MDFYHGSDVFYGYPSLAFCDITEGDERPIKVVLGYYVTPDKSFASNCGENLYHIRMKPMSVAYDMEHEDLVKHYNAARKLPGDKGALYFKTLRHQLVKEGYDLIMIREHTGYVGECVIINMDAIDEFELVETKGIPVAKKLPKRK